MNLTEKIISMNVKKKVSPGDIVIVNVDLVYAHDGTAPLALETIERDLKLNRKRRLNHVILVLDHVAPSPTVSAAQVHQYLRNFSRNYGVKLFDVGYGICHQIIPEEGYVKPGMIIVGADSHTVTLGALSAFAIGVGSTDAAIAMVFGKIWIKVPETVKVVLTGKIPYGVYSKDIILNIIGTVGSEGMNYKSVEFHGDALKELSMDARMTLTNMCTEMGAKAGLIPVDEITVSWFFERSIKEIKRITPDPNAEYSDVLTFEINKLEPQIAAPPTVDNVKSINEVEGVEIDQVFIGSCTNGRYEDLLIATKILKGKSVYPNVRCIVIPSSRNVYLKALRNGLIEELIKAGCTVGPPTCGPCIGAHMGLLAEGEVALSTSNRNFIGRMGHKKSKVYLASPATAAASAIEGKITNPRKFLKSS